MKNKKLTNNARGKQCTLRLSECNSNPETTVAHHVNLMDTKDDLAIVFCCSNCHATIHAEKYSHGNDVARALIETIKIQYADGIINV